MKKLFAAIVISFMLVGTAFAQCGCGWILWMQHASGNWSPLDGYATVEKCNVSEGRSYDRAKVEGKDFIFACFPSDFDPREKK